MRVFILSVLIITFSSACQTNNNKKVDINLSGEIIKVDVDKKPIDEMRFGFVADSQFQTRKANKNENWLRGKLQDKVIGVTLRPPALDWGSRGMLDTFLNSLAESDVDAIFYVGDGANHGCYDELILGYSDYADYEDYYEDPSEPPAPHERGILAVLDNFRAAKGIPVYFVLGNHDFLAAGNTSLESDRKALCWDGSYDGGKISNPALSKWDVMKAIEHFNQRNSDFETASTQRYYSNIDENPQLIEENCLGDVGTKIEQHRRLGCYFAATLDIESPDGQTLQFLLVDTNDYTDVSEIKVGKYVMEALRGAMSFKSANGVKSQTDWLVEKAASYKNTRIIVSHYTVPSLVKSVGPLRLSSKTQRFGDLLLTDDEQENQDQAFVVSAHSHIEESKAIPVPPIMLNCKWYWGSCKGPFLNLNELNVSSTTDFQPGATYLSIKPAESDAEQARMVFSEIKPRDILCEPVYNYIRENPGGLNAIGIDLGNSDNYQDFNSARRVAIYKNLDKLEASYNEKLDEAGLNYDIEKNIFSYCVGYMGSKLEGPQ